MQRKTLIRYGLKILAASVLLVWGQDAAQAAADKAVQTASSAFQPTTSTPANPSGPAPEGIVWIPGGDFSMGCQVPSKGLCSLLLEMSARATASVLQLAQYACRPRLIQLKASLQPIESAKTAPAGSGCARVRVGTTE